MTKCTCGPHPFIDLTPAYNRYSPDIIDGHNLKSFANVRKKVFAACQSHGCFHGCISISPNDRNEISSLAKSIESIERDIESIFASVSEDERDGGMFVVPYPESSLTATFRGRIAESGDPIHPVPEPKLSWEYRRCCKSQQHSSVIVDQCPSSSLFSKLLPEWTDALHSIASLVIELLGIPQNSVLQEGRCKCSHSHCVGPCNIDQLRVFRYDAVDSSAQMMGSSSHSDWGTLTVVWQDEKGGLQTYCHACDAWSDVDASAKSSSSSSMAYFFVHVGDFLSLATDDFWPSPRHRVNCPSLKEESEDEGNGKLCRRSLVYFAYPPLGMSLDDARRVVQISSSSSSLLTYGKLKDISENDELPSVEIYGRYSLLRNQSHRPLPVPLPQGDDLGSTDVKTLDKGEDAFSTYRLIRKMPFDRVITGKWDQVQRK